jgi:hypothetical protein
MSENAITVKERLDAIAKKHGVKKVYELSIPMDDEKKDIAVGYIKKPNRTSLAAAMSVIGTNPLKANEIILKNNWLEGDERILDDDDAFMSAGALLEEVITIRQGEIKKN